MRWWCLAQKFDAIDGDGVLVIRNRRGGGVAFSF